VSVKLYVLDTSYLVELAGCGREGHTVARDTVRKRFAEAFRNGGRFFAPLPCIFELGDHIADVKHDVERARLVAWLIETVESCLEKSDPWLITPTERPEEVLPRLMKCFEPLAIQHRIGLVDSFAAEEGLRLKSKYDRFKGKIHIWTNDIALKKLEPDPEPDPYLWRSDGSPR
jgi:hypothetical protein